MIVILLSQSAYADVLFNRKRSKMFTSQTRILDHRVSKKYSNSDVRILIRFSGTEPLIRLLVEGKETKKVKHYINILEKEIRSSVEK